MTSNRLHVTADVIVFILGRGTIESKAIKKENFKKDVTFSGKDIIPQYLAEHGNGIKYSYVSVPNPKDDSKEYTKEDVDGILSLVKQMYDGGARTFIMSFGTDKMIGVARYIDKFAKMQKLVDIKFVTTGSMDPLENFYYKMQTDAPENLNFIDKEIKNGTLPLGTHIVMHGKYFDPHVTAKDYSEMKFKSFSSPDARVTMEKQHEKIMGDRSLYNISVA